MNPQAAITNFTSMVIWNHSGPAMANISKVCGNLSRDAVMLTDIR